MKNKKYSVEEMKVIVDMGNDKKSFKEIQQVIKKTFNIDRTVKSLEWRYKNSHKDKLKDKKVEKKEDSKKK